MDLTTASRFGDLAGQVEQDPPWLSGAVTKAADGLDNRTDPLTPGDPGQTFNPIADFARRQPAIFPGLAPCSARLQPCAGWTATSARASLTRR